MLYKVVIEHGKHQALFHEEAEFEETAAEQAEDKFREIYGISFDEEMDTHVYPAEEPTDEDD